MGQLDDAVALVYWYESQVDHGTFKRDHEIAAMLGWFCGGWQNGARFGQNRGKGEDGDAGRVRRTRRYVDRNSQAGTLAGYSFGTKRNGSGRAFSHLVTPRSVSSNDALDLAANEQIRETVQDANQNAAERARRIGKFTELKASYLKASDVERAMCCHDLARDLETLGFLRLATISEATQLGILREAS